MSTEMIEIKVTGFKEAVAELYQLPDAVKEIITVSMKDAIQAVQEAAKNRVPVLHGILKEGIITSVRRLSNGDYQGKIGIDTGLKVSVGLRTRGKQVGEVIYENPVRYAAFVEFGSSHAQAFPFLRPALDAQWQNAVTRFANNMIEALDSFYGTGRATLE
jgi:HK97 gp10 family phage protein